MCEKKPNGREREYCMDVCCLQLAVWEHRELLKMARICPFRQCWSECDNSARFPYLAKSDSLSSGKKWKKDVRTNFEEINMDFKSPYGKNPKREVPDSDSRESQASFKLRKLSSKYKMSTWSQTRFREEDLWKRIEQSSGFEPLVVRMEDSHEGF